MPSIAVYQSTAEGRRWLESPRERLAVLQSVLRDSTHRESAAALATSGCSLFRLIPISRFDPIDVLSQWRSAREAWLRVHPQPWTQSTEQEYHRRFSGAIEHLLDAGHGSCLLQRAGCAAIVDNTLHYFDGQRVAMISSVVMPNHVHAVFVQKREVALDKILSSWKGFSARSVNRRLGRSGPLWQRDYFDRLVRDQQHLANCVRYIRRNPVKAKLSKEDYILSESELAKALQ